MAKRNSCAALLRAALKRKQTVQPGYSLRALARDLGLSSAFVSCMLSGKRKPPQGRLEKICYFLELDVLEKEVLIKDLVLDDYSAKILRGARRLKKNARPRATLAGSSKGLLALWVNIAVLEGLSLKPPHCEPENLAARLGISWTDVQKILAELAADGLIVEEDGCWRKTSRLLYVAGGRSRQEIRAFHGQMILKAHDELTKKISQQDFERRLINGFTFAMAPAHLERLKAKVIEFLDEFVQEASDGACEDVYQCNFQFFPLTRKLP